jgi:hypothetical protein
MSVKGNNISLQLDPSCRAHNVFNISQLKLFIPNQLPGREQEPPASFSDLQGEQRWLVDKILDSRGNGGATEYLVRWSGFAEPTWQPAADLKDESGRDIIPLRDFKKARRTTHR